MDRAHPLGVAAGEVVVDRDEVDALAAEAVEVGRQRRHEGLALAGLHLGDPAEVQRRAAHQLDVEVALTDDSTGGFARHGEGLDGQVVEVGAVVEALAELGGLGDELVVGELLQRRFVGVDLGHHRLQRLELLAFTGAEDAIEDSHAGSKPTGGLPAGSGSLPRSRGDRLPRQRSLHADRRSPAPTASPGSRGPSGCRGGTRRRRRSARRPAR